MENVRKHRDIKLVATNKRRNKLASETSYHTTKRFSETLIATEMKKTKLKMNKPIYLGFSILDLSKTVMCKLCYDYVKPKYSKKTKFVIWTQITLLFITEPKIFIKILLMM